MGSKEQLAPGGAMVKAIEAAHLATKGKIVFVTSDLASENAEALVDFFEVDPKAKDIQVSCSAVKPRAPMPEQLTHRIGSDPSCSQPHPWSC